MQVRRWLRERPSIALGSAAFFLSAGSASFSVSWILACVLIAIAALVGWKGVAWRDASASNTAKLTSENAELRNTAAVSAAEKEDALSVVRANLETLLAAISLWIGLDGESRVSLYGIHVSGWYRYARYSSNLSYRVSGRAAIPLGQGVVHSAYLQGEYVVTNLPDFAEDPEGYAEEHRALGVAKAVSRRFTMRSRAYCCFAFGMAGERSRAYVVVFESTDGNAFDVDQLRVAFNQEVRRLASELVELNKRLNGA